MVNKKILREIESKKKGHNLFERQKASDLYQLVELLDARGDIVIDFPPEEWDKAASVVLVEEKDGVVCGTSKRDKIDYARKYIATKLLTKLEEKYPQIREYNASAFLPIFLTGDREAFRKKSDVIYNLKDVEDILEVEGIELDRVHFVMNGTKSDTICDALSMLLSDDTPFSVSIYCSPNGFYTCTIPDAYERTYLNQAYNYTSYMQYAEGVKNKASRPRQKQKTEEQN